MLNKFRECKITTKSAIDKIKGEKVVRENDFSYNLIKKMIFHLILFICCGKLCIFARILETLTDFTR